MKTAQGKLGTNKVSSIALAILLTSFAPILFVAVPAAHAAEPAYCSTIAAGAAGIPGASVTWNDATQTCTVSGGSLVDSGGPLTVTAGTELLIEGTGGLEMVEPLTNYGTILIQTSGTDGLSMQFYPLYNYGVIVIDNSAGSGMDNYYQTVYNEVGGTIIVENYCSGCGSSNGIYFEPSGAGASLVNNGDIYLSSSTSSNNIYITAAGSVTNYGYIDNSNGAFGVVNQGVFTEECGAEFYGTFPSGTTTVNTCGPLFLTMQTELTSIQTTLSSLSLTGLTSSIHRLQTDLNGNFTALNTDFATLQTDLNNNFTSLTTGIGGLTSALSTLQTDLKSNFTGISSSFTTLQTDLNGNFTSLSAAIGTISTTTTGLATSITGLSRALSNDTSILSGKISGLSGRLSTDTASILSAVSALSTQMSNGFSGLSSAISNIGSSGPLVGTSNGATVLSTTLTSARTFSSFSPSSGWTQVATSTGGQVVTDLSVSATSGSIKQGVLYVIWTNGATDGSAYAINVGDISSGFPPFLSGSSTNVQLRFPYSIPSGSTVYVLLVSNTKATADIQLQLVSVPISGPTTVSTST